MLSRANLHSYQKDIISYIHGSDRCGVFAGMGTGKTVATLTALDDLSLVETDVWPALVLAPLRVARSVWPQEPALWDHLSHLKVVALTGTADERKALLATKADIYTLNFENVEWLLGEVGGVDGWPFKTLVVDECFVAGTPVLTPRGDVPIETLVVGDFVETHSGARAISRIYKQDVKALHLVSVETSDGRKIVTTANHPFFTDRGWLPARACRDRQLYGRDHLSDLSNQVFTNPNKGPRTVSKRACPILLSEMPHNTILSGAPRDARDVPRQHEPSECWSNDFLELWAGMVRCPSGEDVGSAQRTHVPCRTGRQRDGTESDRGAFNTDSSGRLYLELRRVVGGLWARLSQPLQIGFREPEDKDVFGSGWSGAPRLQENSAGSEENSGSRVVRVARVPNNERLDMVPVFNIEVEGAPTYFANGALVHNCTRLKSYRTRQGGKRARALAFVAHTKVKRLIGLTGTPSPNGLVDLWGQVWFIDQGHRLGKTFAAFEQRWFRRGYDGYSLKPMPHTEREVQDKLRDICLTVEGLQVDLPVFNNIMVDLPDKVRAQYAQMERDMFAEIEGVGIEAFNAASRTSKLLQLASGSVISDSETAKWEVVHDAKLEALESVIEEAAGAPVLVAYHFRSDLARLKVAFSKAVVLDANPKTIDRWNAGEIPILLAHPASCSHGINLAKGGHILVFFTLDWSLENYLQIIERLGPMRQKQAGLSRPVFVHHILARKTVDEMVLKRLASKRSVQDILLEALKSYG